MQLIDEGFFDAEVFVHREYRSIPKLSQCSDKQVFILFGCRASCLHYHQLLGAHSKPVADPPDDPVSGETVPELPVVV